MNIEFPPELPITEHVDEIVAALTRSQVVVVAGETGSGKTTQLPKICLKAGFGRTGMIGHTQPRRLAARTVATRIAQEMQVGLGAEVGYAVRFTDRVGDDTIVKVMTDGLLLTEIQRDKRLQRYEVIIIDEAHERSLNIDFLLGYLKRLLARRADLRVIITSATIDVRSFAQHFDAPVVEVGGRGYPVDIRYVPDDDDADTTLVGVLEKIASQRGPGPRDVLVFQTGEREIFETARLLRRHLNDRFEVLPLYARLSAADQQRVFRTSTTRRVVLATNVAETSITVPNIGYVVDPGFARINRYSYRSKLERLPIEPISQASANQRAGRCGRIAPGVCYRLYGEDDFLGRPEFTDPEIKRVNLASVVLQMRAWRLGDIERFPFLEPPDPGAVRDAMRLLHELEAIREGQVTDTGRAMARLPVDPRLARMLIAANRERALAEVLVIVAALAIQDPRERPLAAQEKADAAHETFADSRSDFLSFVNLWRWLENLRESATSSGMRKALAQRFLNYQRVREWREVHRQLLLACRHLGMRPNREEANPASVHRALLTGCLSLIGRYDEKGNYQGARNLSFRIFPGSALAGKRPRWLMAVEIAETRRVYARTVAGVQPRWIEQCAGHLLRRRHDEPHWSLKRGEVMAYETVSLYGLPLAERRLVRYASLDPELCRQLFIRDALIAGAVRRAPDFLEHNLRLVAEVQELEARGRRRDLMAHDDVLFAFYDERLPGQVVGMRTLERWLRKAEHKEVHSLLMTRSLLLRDADAAYPEVQFPTRFDKAGVELHVRYRFAPGEVDDGVSVEVPVGMLDALVGEDVEWMVPGLLEPQIQGWLRTLPKSSRKQLLPIADKLPEIARMLSRPEVYRRGKFAIALADALKQMYRLQVSADQWDAERVDPHLRMNVQVRDDRGVMLAQGRHLQQLKDRFRAQTRERLDVEANSRMTGLTAFPDSGVEAEVVVEDGRGRLLAYPALVYCGDTVERRAFSTRLEQGRANRTGYARVAWLSLGPAVRYFQRELDKRKDLGLLFATIGDARTLREDVLLGVAWYCFFEGRKLPVSAEQFTERLEAERPKLADVFNDTLQHLEETMRRRFELAKLLERIASPAYAVAKEDVSRQMARLVPSDVLRSTRSASLVDLPRYLDAAMYRLNNLQGKVGKDRTLTERMAGFESRLADVRGEGQLTDAECAEIGFQLEELRVSVFAQPLNARARSSGRPRISEKKVEKALTEAERLSGLR
ncbi:MAG: ATP-dependent RNA helicase HrpA [Pseudomonadales bacterium]|nr:ATP-dependent RNA helicase HrpA [Pseudomonadales bacterium]MDP6471751.1 ATP-dependent RNA helicase HrpA [Pseudomonadales bacterium]MDP6971417.1 ATP-dependent RNA helicase HrpA [Pseudomonadales bacterium]